MDLVASVLSLIFDYVYSNQLINWATLQLDKYVTTLAIKVLSLKVSESFEKFDNKDPLKEI